MNWRNLVTVCLVLISFVRVTKAQTPIQEYTLDASRSFRLNAISVGVKCTPLLFEKAQLGTITLTNGKIYENIPFNINLNRGDLFIQTDGVDSDPFPVNNWVSVETGQGQKRLFSRERIGAKQEISELLWKGDGKRIVAVHRKTFIRPSTQRDSYSGPQYDEFRHEINYFDIQGMNISEIKTTKRGLKAYAGSKEKEVHELIKKEKLKLENPEDFKLVVELVNK
ncbi:hypothetical protein [Mongoliitalea lutea]|uniref:Uncharacterized protein n=1 Tax=Mongoliitalea lutea TaxID=849756 RepID=A0A8J3CWI4_9BACT|nr:hypothetical protein [Mongoliitalea lutea]GHB28850.1 hypothetical protein GCM10008106_06970 [Mongoliitalea lutea]